MRVLMILMVSLFLTTTALGQQTEANQQETPHLENPITASQLLQLPRRDKTPQLLLKQALKIAERFLKKKNIDLSSSYLFEVKLVQYGGGVEPSWHFLWVSIHVLSKKLPNDISITVSMNGEAKLESRL